MMYSHYSYHQTYATKAPQDVSTATSTSSMHWNGTQWVAAPSIAAVTMSPASYAQTVESNAPHPFSAGLTIGSPATIVPIIKHGKSHAELVTLYTQYYHHWNAEAEKARLLSATLPPGDGKNESDRRERWASYYASNGAALAHYHLSLSQGGIEPYQRPPSPPAPPELAKVTNVANVAASPAGGNVPAVASGSSVATGAAATASTTPSSPVSKTSDEAGAANMANYASLSPPKKGRKTSKKSRWGNAPDSEESKSDKENNGKFSEAEIRDSNASDGESSKSLYLNKFVQEKRNLQSDSYLRGSSPQRSSKGEGDGGYSYYGRASSGDEQLWQENKSEKVSASLGTKRKMIERYESSLSANDSYYGPHSSVANDAKEENFIPLSLSKPDARKVSNEAKKKKVKSSPEKKSAMKGQGFEHHEKALTKRADRFKGKGGIDDVSNVKSTIDNVEKYMGKTVIGGLNRQLDEEDYERMTVKGTCQVLEKEYLRLTSPPRAELVRPQPVLEKHLANIKKSWKERRRQEVAAKKDYNWYCSQLKAIRQDLTVQRIFNAFAVNVYETHAYIALEEDDLNEYNQSQTQLKELYESIHGHEDKEENKGALKNMNEFIAYRIIYYVFLSGNKKYEGGSSDIFKIMLKLTPGQRRDPFIHHALLVRAAVADNDYHKFFMLQDDAPKMGGLLMDKIVPSVRQCALQRMCKAYRPSVSIDFVLKELGFDPNDNEDSRSGKQWMESCGCKLDGESWITKDTTLKESTMGAKNSLI